MPPPLTWSPDPARNLTPSTLPDPGSCLELTLPLAIVHTHAHPQACTHCHAQPQPLPVPDPSRTSGCVPCVHTEDTDTFHTQHVNNPPSPCVCSDARAKPNTLGETLKAPCTASARARGCFQRKPVLQGHFSLPLPAFPKAPNPSPHRGPSPGGRGFFFEPFTARRRGRYKDKEAARSLIPWKIPDSPTAAYLWPMVQTQPALHLGKQQGVTLQPRDVALWLPGVATGSAGRAQGHPALAEAAVA